MTPSKTPGYNFAPRRPGQPGPEDHIRTDPNPHGKPHPPFPTHEQTQADVETDKSRPSADKEVNSGRKSEAKPIREASRP